MRSKAMAWAIVFLLALSFVSAAEEFTATGTGRISGFACSPSEGTVTVFNTGDVASNYWIEAEGPAEDWVWFVPDSFILAPGQSQEVQEFFSIPCDAQSEFLDVVINSDSLELLLSQDIIVATPNNIQLTPEVYSQTVLACDPATFLFTLHNPAEFTETYRISIEDSPEETTLSEEQISLEPRTNTSIAATVRPKDCTLSGEYFPLLTVETKNSKIATELDLFLRINDTDIPEIAEGISDIRASFEAQEASFEIKNIGDRITTYLLDVSGADFVTIVPEQITVDPRDTEEIKFVIQPTEETAPGAYDLVLTTEVEATGKIYTKEFTLKLGPPTFFENLFTAWLPFTIGGIIVLIILIWLIIKGVKKYKTPEYQEKLAERRAEREKQRQIKLALKEEKRRQRQEDKENKEEAKRKDEEREAKEAEKREREIEKARLQAQKEYDKEIRKDNLIIAKDSIITGVKKAGKQVFRIAVLVAILILIILALAFQEAVSRGANAVIAGILILLLILIMHRIRRRKLARGKWKLALANEELSMRTKWRKGITQLTFALNTVVEKLRVTVRLSRATTPPSDKIYQTFVITPNVDGDVVSEARMKFKVKKSWLMRYRITPGAVKLQSLHNERWQSVPTEAVSTDAKYVYFTAEPDTFGEFAITGKEGKKVVKAAKTVTLSKGVGRKIGWTIFGIFVVVAIFALALLIPSGTPTVGIPAQIWKQNTQHTLDLSQYFQDPDQDSLIFSATRTDKIDILFIGDQAVMTPIRGWTGRERTVFLADDGKGGIVKSNPVELIVEPSIIPESFKGNAKPILTFAIIILVILTVWLFRRPLKRIVGLEE